MKTIALLTFIAVYALLLLLPKYRAVSALSAAALFLLLRIVPLGDVAGTVDWNVLMMLAGTMGTVDLFIRSNMPNRLSDRLVAVLPSVKWLIIALALFAGLVSAFVDNVATVLMLAPVGLAISKKLNISPVQPILAIAVSSNLQGAATLVGDTTSILLGGHMGLDFMDFFAYRGRPGLFWVVQAGALMTVPVMLFLFRKEKGKLYGAALTPVTDYLPTCLLLGTVLSLIAASFIPNKPEITNGLICMTFFLAGLAAECGRHGTALAKDVLKAIDYETLALLAGLFLVIRGIERAGIIDDLSHIITGMGGGNLFLTYTIIVWASVLISAFVGVVVGLFAKKLDLQEGEFGKKKMAAFTVANIAAHLLAWVVVAPVLDILIYAEPVKKVFAQGAFAAVSNIITAVVVGGLLVLAYTKTIAKKGSLDQE